MIDPTSAAGPITRIDAETVIRAWQDPDFAASLPEDVRARIPESPAGRCVVDVERGTQHVANLMSAQASTIGCSTDNCPNTIGCTTSNCPNTIGCTTDNCPNTIGCTTHNCPNTIGCSTANCPNTIGCTTENCPNTIGCTTDNCPNTIGCTTKRC